MAHFRTAPLFTLAAYVVDKALATGAIDSNGDINFHMRGTREEIIDGMMATSKAWGSPMTRADAMRQVSREIAWPRRIQRFVLHAAVELIKVVAVLALFIVIAGRVLVLIKW
jgi:hypothetical protein